MDKIKKAYWAIGCTVALIAMAFVSFPHFGESHAGNFIPPVYGEGTLMRVDMTEQTFSLRVNMGKTEEECSLLENTPSDGTIVLSASNPEMIRQLIEEYEIGDLIYVECDEAPGVISDAGQMTCRYIRCAK